ncbi:MAG: tetratricopeptide repeat protein [Planctomycetaceae bacterium]
MKRWLMMSGVFVVLLFAVWLAGKRSDVATASIPAVDISHLHPLVAKAVDASRAEVQANPSSGESWGRYGMVLLAHEFRTAARECFGQAAKLEPDNLRWPYFTGFSFEDSDYKAAFDSYRRAIEIDTTYVPLLLRCSYVCMQLGELPNAERFLLLAKQLEPGNPFVLVAQGHYLQMLGKPEEAERSFESALEIKGWIATPALLELTKLAVRRGDFSQALNYQRRLKEYPETARVESPDPVLAGIREFEGLSKDLAERADTALARGDVASAIRDYEKFLMERPDMPTARTNLARAYFVAGRLDDAMREYQIVLERFGDVVAAMFGVAAVYEQTGEIESGIEQYRKILSVKPDEERAWFELGLLQQKQGRNEDAMQSFRMAVSSNPGFPQAQLSLGILLTELGDYQQAEECFQRAAKLVPGDPIPLQYLQQVRKLSEDDSTN